MNLLKRTRFEQNDFNDESQYSKREDMEFSYRQLILSSNSEHKAQEYTTHMTKKNLKSKLAPTDFESK